MTITLRPFTQSDWNAWAGAEKFGDQEPMICDSDERFVVTLGGSADEGCPLLFVQINDVEESRSPEYAYIPLRDEGWTTAVEVATKLANELAKPDLTTWYLIRALAEYM